jgi:hydrogenase/urease accessory protein HupE
MEGAHPLIERCRAIVAWLCDPLTIEELVQMMVAIGLYLAVAVFPY